MADKLKVYVVTTGEYSDYCIVAVYSEDDKEMAKKAVALIHPGESRIEEFTLGEIRPVDPGMDYYAFSMERNGKTEDYHVSGRVRSDGEPHREVREFRTIKDHSHLVGHRHFDQNMWELKWCGYAKSKEHAIRSAMEIRRQILAGQRPTGVDMGEN